MFYFCKKELSIAFSQVDLLVWFISFLVFTEYKFKLHNRFCQEQQCFPATLTAETDKTSYFFPSLSCKNNNRQYALLLGLRRGVEFDLSSSQFLILDLLQPFTFYRKKRKLDMVMICPLACETLEDGSSPLMNKVHPGTYADFSGTCRGSNLIGSLEIGHVGIHSFTKGRRCHSTRNHGLLFLNDFPAQFAQCVVWKTHPSCKYQDDVTLGCVSKLMDYALCSVKKVHKVTEDQRLFTLLADRLTECEMNIKMTQWEDQQNSILMYRMNMGAWYNNLSKLK